jgi:hypothetical protein
LTQSSTNYTIQLSGRASKQFPLGISLQSKEKRKNGSTHNKTFPAEKQTFPIASLSSNKKTNGLRTDSKPKTNSLKRTSS